MTDDTTTKISDDPRLNPLREISDQLAVAIMDEADKRAVHKAAKMLLDDLHSRQTSLVCELFYAPAAPLYAGIDEQQPSLGDDDNDFDKDVS